MPGYYVVQRKQAPPPEPKPKPKKQVRFAPLSMPAVKSSKPAIRPSKTPTTLRPKPQTQRSSTKERPPISTKSSQPILVAVGLSAVARSMEAKERARAATPKPRQRPPPPPPAVPQRREVRSWGDRQRPSQPSRHSSRKDDILGGYDWARVRTKTTYVWLK